MFKIAKHKDPKLCQACRCMRPAAKRHKFCHKHKARLQRETNPSGYYYNLLRQNAKRRGIPFKLTLEEFREFCEETGYLELKGKGRKDMTIDRIKRPPGYTRDNIQLLTFEDNRRKYWEEDINDCPF